jgi:hypothetical protein
MKHDIQMVESDYKIGLRKAAKKRKVVNAAAPKRKEHPAVREEKRNVDAYAHMREASPTPPPPNDSQTSHLGDAIEPHPDKRISPIPYGLDALHKGPTVSVPTVEYDSNADTRKSPIASGIDAQEHLSDKTTLVNENTTQQDLEKGSIVSERADASDSNADTQMRGSFNPSSAIRQPDKPNG